MKHTLQEMNISHVTTSYYHPQGNSNIEQFYQISHDVMLKKEGVAINLGHLSKSGNSCY